MSGSILSKESQQALFGYNGSRHCTEIPGEVKYFTWIHSFQIEKFVEKLYKSRQTNFLDPDFPKSANSDLSMFIFEVRSKTRQDSLEMESDINGKKRL